MRCWWILLFLVRLGFAADGAALYRQTCSVCHDQGSERAPSREALGGMTAQHVLDALEFGPMVSIAGRRTAVERRAIAEYVTGKSLGQELQTTPSKEAMCSETAPLRSLDGPLWNGWGVTRENSRFQSSPGIAASDVPRLKVKWAFGFPGVLAANAQPVIVAGRVYVGSDNGIVYSLSAATGCVHWYFQAPAAVRAAPTIAPRSDAPGSPYVVYVADRAANVYALDASSGELLWKTKVEDHPAARITGSPQFYAGILYVPVASSEEVVGGGIDYECCKFRGSLVALDAASGRQVWKSYTIAEAPHPTKKTVHGTQLWGPSGAPIWSAPAIDPKGNAIYVATGDNYSEPATHSSDSLLAFELSTGRMLWSRQMTENDAYGDGCRLPDRSNCPESNGPDVDFGSPPILITLAGGKRILVAPQKSGVVHAVDPDNGGKILWQTRVGVGGSLGGVQWGAASDGTNAYVALSDLSRVFNTATQSRDLDPTRGGGMFALRVADGSRAWYTPPPGCPAGKLRCSPAQSAAVSAIPGVAFSGSEDGHLRAYRTSDGAIVWDVDTAGPHPTVNGVSARGGSLDGPGPAIAGGLLVVESGYVITGGMPGNILLAFSVDGK
jgi:polyvinyl alcohol dehydrogenase (cytochrome)